jgi:hypothetical protein
MPDGHKAKLTKDLVYVQGNDLSDGPWAIRVTVPEGFVTDFASTPRLLWILFPPRGKWNGAAIVHDFLYKETFDRFLADAIFRAIMKELGVPWWRRVIMYYAVRFFGGLVRHGGADIKAKLRKYIARLSKKHKGLSQ